MRYPPVRSTTRTAGQWTAAPERQPARPAHADRRGRALPGDDSQHVWRVRAVPLGDGAGAERPDAALPPDISESFYVLDGLVRLFDGQDWFEAGPGEFLYVPPGGIHGYRKESGSPASMLLLFAPGAPREGYFEELARIVETDRELTAEEWIEFFAEHDQYRV